MRFTEHRLDEKEQKKPKEEARKLAGEEGYDYSELLNNNKPLLGGNPYGR